MQRHLSRNPLQRAGFLGAFSSSISRARLRLAVPVAVVAAFLLIPAAQAAANGTMTVHLEGAGSGEVNSVGGMFGGGLYEGDPPIECSGPPESGTCETELENDGEGVEGIALHWTADPGSEVAAVVVNEGNDLGGGCESLNESLCLVYQEEGKEVGEGNADVTVIFEPASGPTEFPLTVTKSGTGTGKVTSSPAGIDCGATCSSEFAEGTEVTLTPAADSGSEFTEWTGACTGSGECKVTIDEAKSVDAVFDPAAEGGTMTVHLEGSGSGEVSSVGGMFGGGAYEGEPPIECSGPPESGTCETELENDGEGVEGIALHWTADPGSEVAAIVVNEGNDLSGFCEGLINGGACVVYQEEGMGDADVTVIFEPTGGPTEFPLTVTKSGTGTGKVTSSPAGIDCGATCSSEFAEGTEVTLTPTADSGSEFKEWTGTACTGSGECKVTMSEAKSVGAKFDLIPTPKHALSVTKTGTGTGTVTSSPAGISCGATCTAEFDQGTEVTLTPSASAGSEFKEWTGACTGTGECKVTMSAAKSVGAKFDLAPKPKFTLTITKAGTGSGSVTCNGGACASSYDQGTTITLAASPASGSSFAGWSGAGCSGTGTCVVTLNADTTVTATFNANPAPPVVKPPVVVPPVTNPPPPPAPQCVVPTLAKKTLSQAKAALKAANCALGKVTKPKKKKGPLVAKSSKPGAGTIHPAGSKVDLKLGPKPNSKKR